MKDNNQKTEPPHIRDGYLLFEQFAFIQMAVATFSSVRNETAHWQYTKQTVFHLKSTPRKRDIVAPATRNVKYK